MIAADRRSACAGAWSRACRCMRRSSSARAISSRCSTTTASRSAIWPPAASRRSATTSCRCWTGRAPNWPPAPRRRAGAALQRARIRGLRLLHAGAAGRRGRPRARRARAREGWFDKASEDDKRKLLANIMAGLPGAFDRYDVPGLRRMLDRYKGMTRETLARKPRALPAGGDPDRRGGRRAHVHPPGRPAAPAAGPAAHRQQRRGPRLHRRGGAVGRRTA